MTTRKPARRAARPAATADQDAAAPASPPTATARVPSPPRAPAAPSATTRSPPQLKVVKDALADMKAVDARVLDVRGLTDISDYMVIASGTSDRHVRSIADNVVRMAKAAGVRPFGVEGAKDGEWVLVDLPDVMVHVMLPRVREFYGLEQLWEPPPAPKAAVGAGGKPRRAAGSRAPARAGNGAAARKGKATGTAARKAPRPGQGGPRRRPPRAG